MYKLVKVNSNRFSVVKKKSFNVNLQTQLLFADINCSFDDNCTEKADAVDPKISIQIVVDVNQMIKDWYNNNNKLSTTPPIRKEK